MSAQRWLLSAVATETTSGSIEVLWDMLGPSVSVSSNQISIVKTTYLLKQLWLHVERHN